MTENEFRQGFEEYKDAVYGFALRMTGSAEVAEDVAQDCFVEWMRNPGSFDPSRGPMRAFLLGVARNLVYQHWRGASRLDPLDEDLEWPEPSQGDGSVAMMVAAASGSGQYVPASDGGLAGRSVMGGLMARQF